MGFSSADCEGFYLLRVRCRRAARQATFVQYMKGTAPLDITDENLF